jgi:hypothetical protein
MNVAHPADPLTCRSHEVAADSLKSNPRRQLASAAGGRHAAKRLSTSSLFHLFTFSLGHFFTSSLSHLVSPFFSPFTFHCFCDSNHGQHKIPPFLCVIASIETR